jgi:hypothetical protein
MENNYFITITGTKHYYGMKPFEIGRIIKLVKEPYNEYDREAIRAELPFIDKIGYVANSVHTVVKGTFSGGRIYDLFEKEAFAQVLFVTNNGVICLLVLQEEANDKNEITNGEITDSKAAYTKGKIGFHL